VGSNKIWIFKAMNHLPFINLFTGRNISKNPFFEQLGTSYPQLFDSFLTFPALQKAGIDG
jgi:hypothetical protein